MVFFRPWLCVLLSIYLSVMGGGVVLADEAKQDTLAAELNVDVGGVIDKKVRENYTFYGLASYYNDVNYYVVAEGNIRRIDENEKIVLSKGQWLVAAGRFNVLVIKADGLSARLDGPNLSIDNPALIGKSGNISQIVIKPKLSSIAPELDQVRYAHLWGPLAWLAKGVERSLVTIHSYVGIGWGMTLVIFGILLKICLLPVGIMTMRFQRRVSQVEMQLAPRLAEIKANFDGEEAHNRLMSAYKKLSVSPFYTLKPMLGSFVQIPILIAVFNALGEMPQFANQSFLWMANFGYPDAIGHFPSAIPLFGDTISLLPFIMTLVTLFSTVIFKNRHASEAEMKRKKRNLYLMAAVFFALFYPFPAVMVLYWTLANTLQTVQEQLVKI